MHGRAFILGNGLILSNFSLCISVICYKIKFGTPPPTRTGNTLLLREPRLPIAPVGRLVVIDGIEPPTVTVWRCCSTNWATLPKSIGGVYWIRTNDAGFCPHAFLIGSVNLDQIIHIKYQNKTVFEDTRSRLQSAWTETSYKIQSMRDNPVCALEEFSKISDFHYLPILLNLLFFHPYQQHLCAKQLLKLQFHFQPLLF